MPNCKSGLQEAARTHLVLLRKDPTRIEHYVRLAHEYGISVTEIAAEAWLTVDFVSDILRGDRGDH